MTTTPSPVPTRPTPTLDRMFDALRRSPVTRSRQRVLAGVCSGLAERFGVSVTIVRVVAVIAALLGPAVVLYLLAWLVLPDADGGVRLEQAVRGGDAASILLLVVTVLAVVPDAGVHGHVGWFFPVLVAGAIGAFFWSRSTGRGQGTPWSSGTAQGPRTPQTPQAPQGPQGPQDTFTI